MSNKFSSRSKSKLKGVHPDLVKVMERAIEISTVDFGLTEGLRTLARQRQLISEGKSQTMRSRHLSGHAVDVVAYVGGSYTYENFDDYVAIAEAVRQAAIELGVPITWGSAWLRPINTYGSARAAMDHYVYTRRSQGKRPFMDGPHFQLTWEDYP